MAGLFIALRATGALPFANRERWRRQLQRTDRDTHPPSPQGRKRGDVDMTDRQVVDVPRNEAM
eukprot:2650298-Pleurochrysis_carterae.AAC.2